MIGDVALCAGGYTFTPASGESGSNGFWTKVVGKAGGHWKILNLTYTIAAPSRSALGRRSASRASSREPSDRPAPDLAQVTRNGSRSDWLRSSRRSPRKA